MTESISNAKYRWRCPSNIAIVKYWGKKENQIPCNSSLSMTLSNSFTEVELELKEKTTSQVIELSYFFEGKRNIHFEQRVHQYLKDQVLDFPFLNQFHLTFHSTNSFPHSAGIASSASAFGAIALSILDAAQDFSKESISQEYFFKKASSLARLGSGSACRSMFSGYAVWGKNEAILGSNDEFAIELPKVHPNFQNMQDAILIVEKEPKKVSSSVGHSLMRNHPYAQVRFLQANERTKRLHEILLSGDFEDFIQITESEALTLHAMMLTSKDYYLLMKSGTLLAIEKIMEFRKETGIPICFTLDAGPNVHVLYAQDYKEEVNRFLNSQLTNCVQEIIFDNMGAGPNKMTR